MRGVCIALIEGSYTMARLKKQREVQEDAKVLIPALVDKDKGYDACCRTYHRLQKKGAIRRL
jgi:thymidine kinase